MSVSNGQIANAATFNGAFLSRTTNTSTVGTVTLNNTSDVNSGSQIINLQRSVNEVFNAVGMTGEADPNRNIYGSNNVITDGQDRKQAISALDATFDINSGHDHDGSNSKSLSALDLSDINIYKAEWITLQLAETSQVEEWDFTALTGSNYDVVGNGLFITLAGGLGYAWLNVTDGVETQTDPLEPGTSVQVDILLADTAEIIVEKIHDALVLASITGIDSVIFFIDKLQLTYDPDDITDGDAGTSASTYTLITNGIDNTGVGGLTVDISGYLVGESPDGSENQEGITTASPFNRVEIRDFITETFIEDAEGQKVYGRITEAAGVWTLSFYTNEAGVETAHNLAQTQLLVYYRKVFTLADLPTFGVDAAILGSLDLTNDIIPATNTLAGKVTLNQIRVLAQPTVEIRTITAGEETNKELILSATPLTTSKVILDVRGAAAQFYGDDYTVSGSTLSWSGLGLDGLLSDGDKVRIIYWT